VPESVRVYGGLCNRLRAILSRRARDGEVMVHWPVDGEIHDEHFTSAFHAIPGVTFVPEADPSWERTLDAVHCPEWERGLLDVKLLNPSRWKSAEPYVAVHVRRTDAIGLQKQDGTYEDDKAWLDWIERRSEKVVYLAVDNGTTQAKFASTLFAMGKRPEYYYPIDQHARENESFVRNTTLRHAWCDIEACVGAMAFKGCGSSSFTRTIEALRALRGKT